MANVHLQEAATNVRRAISDLKTLQQQLKSSIDHQVRDNQQRQNTIKTEEAALKIRVQSNDKTAQAQGLVLIQQLEKEHSDISQHINNIRGEADRQIQNLNQQIAQYEGMARQLESSA